MEAPEKVAAESSVACSKCALERREAQNFCPRCGFPYASVFRQPISTLQSLEPVIKTGAALFGVSLLFLLLKVTPETVHLHIEILVQLLFSAVVLYAVYPFRSKIYFLCRRFSYLAFPPLTMVFWALLTAAGIHFYFMAIRFLGMRTADYIESGDLGTATVPWVFISTVVLAPLFEEIYFRGYLYRKFRLVLKPREAIVLQGLLFGIIHLSPAAYISHAAMGVLFGYFRHRTKSLLPGMLFHAMWNLSVVGIEYWRLTA